MDLFFLPTYLAKLSGKIEERCYLDGAFHLRQPSLSGEKSWRLGHTPSFHQPQNPRVSTIEPNRTRTHLVRSISWELVRSPSGNAARVNPRTGGRLRWKRRRRSIERPRWRLSCVDQRWQDPSLIWALVSVSVVGLLKHGPTLQGSTCGRHVYRPIADSHVLRSHNPNVNCNPTPTVYRNQ